VLTDVEPLVDRTIGKMLGGQLPQGASVFVCASDASQRGFEVGFHCADLSLLHGTFGREQARAVRRLNSAKCLIRQSMVVEDLEGFLKYEIGEGSVVTVFVAKGVIPTSWSLSSVISATS